MKKSVFVAFLALVMVALCSCSGDMNISKSQLYGTWQEVGTQQFVRFLTAQEDTIDGNYRYGYEWDVADGVTPDMLQYHGNGWFKWDISGSTLTRIHLMDNGGALIPKTYTITQLDSTGMRYKDSANKERIFRKIL